MGKRVHAFHFEVLMMIMMIMFLLLGDIAVIDWEVCGMVAPVSDIARHMCMDTDYRVYGKLYTVFDGNFQACKVQLSQLYI